MGPPAPHPSRQWCRVVKRGPGGGATVIDMGRRAGGAAAGGVYAWCARRVRVRRAGCVRAVCTRGMGVRDLCAGDVCRMCAVPHVPIRTTAARQAHRMRTSHAWHACLAHVPRAPHARRLHAPCVTIASPMHSSCTWLHVGRETCTRRAGRVHKVCEMRRSPAHGVRQRSEQWLGLKDRGPVRGACRGRARGGHTMHTPHAAGDADRAPRRRRTGRTAYTSQAHRQRTRTGGARHPHHQP